MEFLRFGSSIPGGYWGCCAGDIIQNFNVDPDEKAAIQLVSGDGGGGLTRDKKMLLAGPTYRDIFNTRIRIGTFSGQDMPNHFFLAVLTEGQLIGEYGAKWLAILKEAGFEFVRTVDNSVYSGPTLDGGRPPHPNHIFGLFRNIGDAAIKEPHQPPAAWLALPEQTKSQTEIWNDTTPTVLITEDEATAAGVPIYMAGKRSQFPQELKEIRESKEAKDKPAAPSSPFAAAPASPPIKVKAKASK